MTAALEERVRRAVLSADPNQISAGSTLDRIALELGKPKPLFGHRAQVHGAYLVGSVGRGKTMLMDLLFAAAPVQRKRRLHFHEFMDEAHAAIATFRASPHGKGDTDPVIAIARQILERTRLLCLDEFQVEDITNAMLLGRLFTALFAGGLTLVATSNTLPDALYLNGLNRQLFLPFIDLLKEHAKIVSLDGPTDYRQLKFAGEAVFRFGTGPEVEREMDALWLRLTGGEAGMPAEVESLGRHIVVPRAAMGAARFAFADLCEAPLGARDYLRIAHAFDTIMIDGVPQFDRLRSDASKRFILLVDTLYDSGVRLAASFAAPIVQLAGDDRTAAAFARTSSRLAEMQSEAYLRAPRKPVH